MYQFKPSILLFAPVVMHSNKNPVPYLDSFLPPQLQIDFFVLNPAICSIRYYARLAGTRMFCNPLCKLKVFFATGRVQACKRLLISAFRLFYFPATLACDVGVVGFALGCENSS